MTALSVIPPEHYIGAVESIPLIVDLIERLRGRGTVYEVDGDLYFSVRADPRFGDVSGYDDAQMLAVFAERGGDPDRPGKRDPLDCLLWQAARPGEPSWETSLGAGRPGWHVECSAIAMHYLGAPFDVQGGGTDLAFPHHEMSAGEAPSGLSRGPVRLPLRARGHGGLRRSQDVEVARQPGFGLPPSGERRRPAGDPVGPALPALPLGLGVAPGPAPGGRGPAGPLVEPPSRAAVRTRRSSRSPSASPSPTTWTRRPRSSRSTLGGRRTRRSSTGRRSGEGRREESLGVTLG